MPLFSDPVMGLQFSWFLFADSSPSASASLFTPQKPADHPHSKANSGVSRSLAKLRKDINFQVGVHSNTILNCYSQSTRKTNEINLKIIRVSTLGENVFCNPYKNKLLLWQPLLSRLILKLRGIMTRVFTLSRNRKELSTWCPGITRIYTHMIRPHESAHGTPRCQSGGTGTPKQHVLDNNTRFVCTTKDNCVDNEHMKTDIHKPASQ